MTNRYCKKPSESTRVLMMKYKGLRQRFLDVEEMTEFEVKMFKAIERTLHARGVFKDMRICRPLFLEG